MTVTSINTLFPAWTHTLHAMRRSLVQVRSQCTACGIQQRVDLDALSAKLGPMGTLIGRRDRCSLVACHGSAFYLAARSYGRQWITLLDHDGRYTIADTAPATNAEKLGLLPLSKVGG